MNGPINLLERSSKDGPIPYSVMLVSLKPTWVSLFSPWASRVMISSGVAMVAANSRGNFQTPPLRLITCSSTPQLRVGGDITVTILVQSVSALHEQGKGVTSIATTVTVGQNFDQLFLSV